MAKKITRIPATKQLYTNIPIADSRKKRVCGYARVSTDHEEQQSSYEAQLDYYTKYIKAHDDWEFVGMYSDEAKSGTSTKKRDGFNRMVDDALSGKIDLIITKSVSRFARNTVDSLKTIRSLKEKGVEVFFEEQNIWTFDARGELLITIMSSLAQEESRSISENTTWGRRKQMADGKVSFNYHMFLGYDMGEDGKLHINEEEAETVRLIYKLFLAGLTYNAIAKELQNQGRKAPGGKNWHDGTVRSILTNEKYKGDVLLQKYYTVDFLTKKMAKNDGTVTQYYIEDHHEPIVSEGVFERVQREIERRMSLPHRYVAGNIFASKLICGECGCFYGSRVWHSNDKYRRVVWQCNGRYYHPTKCKTPHVTEDEIKACFNRAMELLWKDKDTYIEDIEILKEDATQLENIKARIKEVDLELPVLAEEVESLVYDNARSAKDQNEYQKIYAEAAGRYEEKVAEKENLIKKLDTAKARAAAIDEFIETLKQMKTPTGEFDMWLWGSMVESMTLEVNGDITFNLKSGMRIKT
ncbi:recombinase family protein [Butyrivibrio sp. CB08]|uniref:recombinase family protein n=1 Tax=Butyrivibrio sp. CB08 TaxID=2364879 RepID=UPI000EA9CAF1|nr:recombinase family protein [Butyrivibrio sp. CB08]RKM55396.1 recombinase family protein [Butyrivibrio sp. CB08]